MKHGSHIHKQMASNCISAIHSVGVDSKGYRSRRRRPLTVTESFDELKF